MFDLMKQRSLIFFATLGVVSWMISSGCGGGTSAPTTPAQIPTSVEYATIDGQVLVASGDLDIAVSPSVAKTALTSAVTPLPNAPVTLYKMYADGTEELVSDISTTTDDNGNYSLSNVPVAVTGTGASTDFYYEIRATSGNIVVKAPTAPTADATINVTPETKVAALTMKNDTAVSGAEVTPLGSLVDRLRDTVSYTLVGLGSYVKQPSTLTSAEDYLAKQATGLANNNDNAEYITRAVKFNRSYIDLTGGSSSASISKASAAETEAAAVYLENIIRRSCLFDDDLALSSDAINEFASAFLNGTTVMPTEVITAYNNNTTSDTTASAAVSLFNQLLADIETAFTQGMSLSTADVKGVYSQREMTTVASDTELELDQSWAFMEETVGCGGSGLDLIGYTNELLGSSLAYSTSQKAAGSSTVGYIVEENLYSVYSGGACGGLAGTVRVYAKPGTSITSVVVTGAGDPLTLPVFAGQDVFGYGSNVPEEAECALTTNVQATLTITATFSDSSTSVETKTFTPIEVTSARITSPDRSDGDAVTVLSTGAASPTPVNYRRPLLIWSPAPGTANVSSYAPAGAQLMYIFSIYIGDETYSGSSPADGTTIVPPIGGVSARIHTDSYVYDTKGKVISRGLGTDSYYCLQGSEDCSYEEW
jgi:hypothetical protein